LGGKLIEFGKFAEGLRGDKKMARKDYDDNVALHLIRQGSVKEATRPTTNTMAEVDALTIRMMKVKDSSPQTGGPEKK